MSKKAVWVKPEIRKAFQNKVVETINKYTSTVRTTTVIPIPEIIFARLGRTAGRASRRQPIIYLNPDFFKKHYDDMLNSTCPHEVAHYINHVINGPLVQAHGWEWKRIMAFIGLPAAERCHQYDLEGVKMRRVEKPFRYGCGCEGRNFDVTLKVHKKHQIFNAYFCKKCRVRLIYKGMIVNGIFMPASKVQTKDVIAVSKSIATKPVAVRDLLNKVMFNTTGEKIKTKEPTHRVVTKLVNGVLTNVRIPLDNIPTANTIGS